jgi:hypothetical protein
MGEVLVTFFWESASMEQQSFRCAGEQEEGDRTRYACRRSPSPRGKKRLPLGCRHKYERGILGDIGWVECFKKYLATAVTIAWL